MDPDPDYDYISDEDVAAYLDGNAPCGDIARIFTSIERDPVLAETLALSPVIDRAIKCAPVRRLPMHALAAANADNLCSFECELRILTDLGFDTDHWSLLEEAKANKWISDGGTPLHLVGKLLELKGLWVERRYDASVGDIARALADGRRVIVVVDGDPAPGPMHALLVTGTGSRGSITHTDPASGHTTAMGGAAFEEAWARSGHYMVTASAAGGVYDPQPVSVDDIELDADLEQLTEAIAENAHDIWARARLDEGWTYGPVRNDSLRQHPDLVPYAQLPDSEKEYDRLMAMNTLRLVHRLGFDISNHN